MKRSLKFYSKILQKGMNKIFMISSTRPIK
jgi:hypothetical protein